IGLLITVDEVDARFDEMLTLVADFQHFVREKRNVALLMAALPGKVLQMFNNDSVTFVRRSFQHRLDTIKRDDARLAIRKTIEASGRSIESDALEVAVERTGGFPFLVQLVGYHIWRQSSQSKQISLEDARRGIISAEEDMDRMILETTIKELSDKDVAFLHAMAQDDAESRLGDVAKRLKISSAAAGQYRLRLIRQGVIEEYGRGKVQFALPLLRDYLRKTGA
ncbi:MAG: ATP-binding protein, partial [Coriobacteriales bacterium]|nr:ATP-binding protein [Coriobacteriales bacterium]